MTIKLLLKANRGQSTVIYFVAPTDVLKFMARGQFSFTSVIYVMLCLKYVDSTSPLSISRLVSVEVEITLMRKCKVFFWPLTLYHAQQWQIFYVILFDDQPQICCKTNSKVAFVIPQFTLNTRHLVRHSLPMQFDIPTAVKDIGNGLVVVSMATIPHTDTTEC